MVLKESISSWLLHDLCGEHGDQSPMFCVCTFDLGMGTKPQRRSMLLGIMKLSCCCRTVPTSMSQNSSSEMFYFSTAVMAAKISSPAHLDLKRSLRGAWSAISGDHSTVKDSHCLSSVDLSTS